MFASKNLQSKDDKGASFVDGNKNVGSGGLFEGINIQTPIRPIFGVSNLESENPFKKQPEGIFGGSTQNQTSNMNLDRPNIFGTFGSHREQLTESLFKKTKKQTVNEEELNFGKTNPDKTSNIFLQHKTKSQCEDLPGPKNKFNPLKQSNVTETYENENFFGGTTQPTKEGGLFGQQKSALKNEVFTQQQPQKLINSFSWSQPEKRESKLFGPLQTSGLFGGSGSQQQLQQGASTWGKQSQHQVQIQGLDQLPFSQQHRSQFGETNLGVKLPQIGQPQQNVAILHPFVYPVQCKNQKIDKKHKQRITQKFFPHNRGFPISGGLTQQSRATQLQQQQSSLFGAVKPQISGSLLGNSPQNTGGLFGSIPQQNARISVFGDQQQQRVSLFSGQGKPLESRMYGNSGSAFDQQKQNLYGFAQAFSSEFGNLSMQISIPLTLVNKQIMNPNYQKSINDMLAVVTSVLIQGGAISLVEADKVVKKRQQQLLKQYCQQQSDLGISSVFGEPINFNDSMELRLANFQAEQKDKEENDMIKINISQTVKPREETSVLTKLRKKPKDVSKAVKNKIVSARQLPQVNEYTLKPSLSRLSKMTVPNLREVYDVEVSGEYGSIKFLEPISLLLKEIDFCVDIKQDKIDITEPSWRGKKCELTFFNFAQYKEKSGDEKQQVENKMYKWIERNQEDKMELVHFDQDEGTLVVTIN